MEGVTLAITSFGVGGNASKVPELVADSGVLEPTILFSGAVSPSIESANFFDFFGILACHLVFAWAAKNLAQC